MKEKGWSCDLVPKGLIVARYFSKDAQEIADLDAEAERVTTELAAFEEEHGNEDGLYSELVEDGEVVINAAAVKARLKEIRGDRSAAEEAKALKAWLDLSEREKELKGEIKQAEAALDAATFAQYPKLSVDEVKALVVDDKWMASLATKIGGETARVAQGLTRRVKELGERYGSTLPALTDRVSGLEKAVAGHLAKMGCAF